VTAETGVGLPPPRYLLDTVALLRRSRYAVLVPKTPERFHILTPSITVRDAKRAMQWYQDVLGAKVVGKPMFTPDGSVMHAELQFGDSVLMMNDEMPNYGVLSPLGHDNKTAVTLHLYVDDVDAVFAKAVEAGATPTMPVADQFWGDRFGSVKDPFGHSWGLATHIREMTEEEMKAAMQKSGPNAAGA